MNCKRTRCLESLDPRCLLTATSLITQPAILDSAIVLDARDMDSDGDHDILVSKNDSIAWLENQSENGHLRFEEHLIAEVSSRLFDVADLDGDHDLDLIVREKDGVAILESTDDGFVSRRLIDNPPELLDPWLVRAVDLDTDGDRDLIIATPGFLGGGGELSWYANDGVGNFNAPRNVIGRASFRAFAIADLDGDIDQDLILSTVDDTPISFLGWLKNTEQGAQFEPQLTFGFNTGGANDITASDFDDDDDLDLLIADRIGGPGIWLYENTDGLGEFAEPQNVYDLSPTWSLAVADMDGDGDEDIVTTLNREGGGITVLSKTDSGYEPTTSQTETLIREFLLADVDVDGRLDVLLKGDGGWLRNQLAGDFDNDGKVGFKDFLVLSVNFGKSNAEISDGDLDANGLVDFADFLILAEQFGKVTDA